MNATFNKSLNAPRAIRRQFKKRASSTVFANAAQSAFKDVSHVVFAIDRSEQFADSQDTPNTALESRDVNDEIDAARDIVAYNWDGEIEACHRDHHFHTGQGVAGIIRVNGRERAFVAGIHGLEHVQRLGATDFTDDDSIGSHPEAVANQFALAILAMAFGVGRPGFHAHNVRMIQDEFGGILHRDDSFITGNGFGKCIEQRRFPAPAPPEMMMFNRDSTAAERKSAIG